MPHQLLDAQLAKSRHDAANVVSQEVFTMNGGFHPKSSTQRWEATAEKMGVD